MTAGRDIIGKTEGETRRNFFRQITDALAITKSPGAEPVGRSMGKPDGAMLVEDIVIDVQAAEQQIIQEQQRVVTTAGESAGIQAPPTVCPNDGSKLFALSEGVVGCGVCQRNFRIDGIDLIQI